MKALQKNIFREIKHTKSRFISIFAIIALSVGFFSGVKASSPSMIKTALTYYESQNLMDINLLSTVGFDNEDVQNIKNLHCVTGVMPGYRADLIITKDHIDSVVRVYSLPQKTETNSKMINEPILIDGRLPKESGECVIENYYINFAGYQLGDFIEFNPKTNGKDTLNTVKNLKYKIVGIVQSPLYITYSRGTTNIGSGSIEFYMMILPEEFNSERYTNLYVTTNAGENTSAFEEEYKNNIDTHISQIEMLSKDRIKKFNQTTLADAKKELSDARKEYAEKKQEAESKLSDGEKELHDGEEKLFSELVKAQNQLADGEKEIQNAKEQLEAGQKEYTEKITQAKQTLIESKEKYNTGKEEYTKAKNQYDTEIAKAQYQLDTAHQEFQTQYDLFYLSTKPDAENKLTLLKTAIDTCNKAIKTLEERLLYLRNTALQNSLNQKLEEYKTKLEEYQLQYEEGEAQLSEGEQQLLKAKEQLQNAQEEFQTKKWEGAEKLNQAQIELDNAQNQLEIGQMEYEAAMNNGLLELQAAQTKISESQKELENGKQELETQKINGMKQLKEARQKLAEGKYQAHVQLDEAELKLKDAQKTIETLEDAKWYVYNRDNNPGYSGLEEDALRVDHVASVFPVFFLIVAALVCLTTMTRMVEERRTEIGTLKALGYSDIAISAKYFVYAASAALLGSIFGCIIGLFTFPFIILDTYSMMYTLPATILVVSWDSILISSGTGILCTCLVAVIACFKELKLKPAALMRPKAPKPGKRILLEHIPFLWKRMSFTSKVTARNLFRYKARFLMTVIGVAGCTALIIAGFGLKDSISVVGDRQFKEISKYDQIYALSSSGSAKEKEYLMSQFHKDDRFSETLLGYMGWTTVYYPEDSSIELRIIIGQNKNEFEKMFILRNRKDHAKITLTDDGVVITERLSEVIHKTIGDTIEFSVDDTHYHSKITGITENYAGNYIYMTPKCYETITNQEMQYNIIYTSLTESAKANEKEIANDWMKSEEIMTVSLLSEQLDSILETMDSLNIIVLVLIICAGLLAIVVLYNLTNINIDERIREIATIKVLGFYNLETANYIYRENIILTICGAIAGLFLGKALSVFIVLAIQMDMVMFPQEVKTVSYLYGFLLTLIFALFVNFIMYFKINKINMVESLKSIE